MSTHAPTSPTLTGATADVPAVSRPDFQRLARLIAVNDAAQQLTVTSPLDGSVLGTIPLCTVEDVDAALARARTAQKEWAALSLKERVRPFIAAHDMFLDGRDALADIIQLENGKARIHAIEEPMDVAINLRFYGYHAQRFLSQKRMNGALPFFTRTTENRLPWGVVGMIHPWNYPLTLPISDAIAALIAGNAVVLKPSELTPYSVLAGLELLRRAGVPDDIFQIITGDGATTGTALVERADYIMFTGSTAIGRKIAEQCGRRLISYSMELGGKNPAVVLDDANVDKAVTSITDGMLVGSGQTCVSLERLYVQSGIYDTFVKRLTQHISNTKIGLSLTDFNINIGSLTSAAQVEKVKSHVDDAVGKGARVLTGGTPRPDIGPYVFAPTLLDHVTPDMTLYKTETFGPVLSVYPFSTEAEVISACNDSDYGLHAAVYSSDTRRAQRIAQQLQTGTVSINENHKAAWASVHSPQGGFKQSGTGRRHGPEGITKYTQVQNVSTQRFIALSPTKLLPPTRWVSVFGVILRSLRWIPGFR